MNFLLLDIDGVLNTDHTYTTARKKHLLTDFYGGQDRYRYGESAYCQDLLEPKNIAVVNDLVLEHNFKVVLSSTWRIFYGHYENLNETWLPSRGATFQLHDKTVDGTLKIPRWIERGEQRGEEILHWLTAHVPSDERAATNVVIIDDIHPQGGLGKYHLQTSPLEGLLPKHKRIIDNRMKRGWFQLSNKHWP